jgi:hypothetical protein
MNVLPAHVPLGRICAYSLRDGRLAELYRVSCRDATESMDCSINYRKIFLLTRALQIDGQKATTEDVLNMDNSDAEHLFAMLYRAMNK